MYPLDLVRALQMADSGSGGVKKTVGQLLGTFKDTYGVQGFFTQVHPPLPYPIMLLLHSINAPYQHTLPTPTACKGSSLRYILLYPTLSMHSMLLLHSITSFSLPYHTPYQHTHLITPPLTTSSHPQGLAPELARSTWMRALSLPSLTPLSPPGPSP